MARRLTLFAIAALVATVGPSARAPCALASPEPAASADADVRAIVKAAREPHGVPGMAALVLRGSTVVASAADGVRKAGDPTPVTINDRWHLGSDTKAMTATLCATLVEAGKLSWDRTMAQAFPELVPKMDAGWKSVTLTQLLTHTGGVPSDLSRDGLWGKLWAHKGTPRDARRLLLEGVIAHAPESTPGTKYLYSNAGVSIAGHMAECVMGEPWEMLIEKRIFKPLGITTAGFGAPGTPGRIDQPWGHHDNGTPVEPGPGADNPPAISPAGRAYMTIGDWAKFVALHLRGAQGDAKLLKPESFVSLQTPPKGFDYAMGWAVTSRAWSPPPILTHNGSNTMWFCVTWLAPKKDFAVLVTSNRGGAEAAKACDDVAGALIGAFINRTANRPK